MTSVLCPSCFFATDHTGHDTSNFTITAFGTFCDCGDPSAWNREINCPDHPLTGPSRDAPGAEHQNEDIAENSIKVMRLLWQFIVTTMYHAHGPVAIPPPGTSAQLYDDAFGTAPGKPQDSVDVKQGEPISLVLWADEKHTSREIARQVGIVTGYEHAKVASLIEELENEVGTTKGSVRLLLIPTSRDEWSLQQLPIQICSFTLAKH
jgi:E3 ubiquitin-protein ligase UBR1